MAILTSKDRKKLNNAAKKKKNTDTGRTAAEKQRKKSVAENAAAEKKKNKSSASKKKATSSSVLNDTEKKEVEEIRRRTQSLRDRNTAVSQRDAYDAARRKSYGERESVKESKTKFGDIVRSDARDLVQTGSVPKRHYDYGLKKYVTEEESRTASRTRDEYDQNVRASYGARNNQRVEGIYTSGNNTTKKKTSHMEETRQYDDALKNAMKLEPDEMYGVKMGSAEDALKEAEDFSDKNKLQNSADNARLYLNAWDRIDPKDHGQAAAYIVYGIGLNDETRNTVMNAFKNASDDDRIAIYQAAIQTVGYTDDVKKMENQLKSGIKWASDNDYRNKVKTAAFVNSTSTPAQNIQKAAEDLKSGAKGQPTARQINLYNSYQKGIEFSKEWAKTHDYSNMDYFIDKYYGANDAFLAGLIDAVGLNVADLTDVDKEGYLLGGIVSPWKGMSDEKSFLDNGVQMLTNIVNSVLSITKLPLKLMTKGLSYIPGMDESLDEASEEALRWSADLQKAIQFYDFKTEYAGADKSKLVKTAGNIESFVVENIPGIALSIVYPAAGTAVFGAQAGGSYGRAAYESGATLDEAISYGTIAALAEVGTEKLFPMAGTFGKSLTERIFSTTAMRTARDKYLYQTTIDMLEKSGFRNSVSGRILKNVLEGGGEATEEMIMEIVNPYLQRAIYDEGAENADLSSILESGLYGLAVAAVLHLPSNVLNVTGDSLGALRRLNYKITAADQKRDTIKIIRNELSLGLITEEEAKKRLEEADINYALAMELYDVATGKGSLRVADEAAYEEKTESDTRRIYDSAEEAQKYLKNELKGKKIGDEVKGAYFDGDTVREFTAAKTEEGVKYRTADQTEGDIETYRAKAEKVKNAKNETERSGYQLNVKEDIIKEVSALSKALGRTIVFDEEAKTYNEDGSANVTRGWFDEKDGSVHVNIHNETPAATVVAHEITHSMEGTKAYKAMQKAVFDYYRSSLGAERKERGALYAEGGKTLESEKDVDYEVMANFVETKLLTDKETINYIVKRNKTFGERIVNGINRIIQRKIGSKEQKFLAGVRKKWEAALEESRKEGDKKRPSGDIVYSETEEIRKKYGEKEPYNRIAGRKYSVGKERDREYMDAVERGDMETAQRMVDHAAKDAGYTEKLYHQTDAEFTVFEPRHKGAGSRDNETPYGIFMKTSSANIGLKGNKQMELYAKIQNPLVAYDRRSLRKMIESMSPEYRNLKEEIKNIDKEYGEKFENAKTGWTNYITEWRKNNPDAKRTALYDDPEFQRLFDEEDRIIAEWTEKASNLDERAKEEITRTLTDSGYDGIILSRDEGSFGRSTDAYIALDSSQVKSADAVTYDDKGNVIPLSERFDVGDADIRYSLGKEKRKVSAEMGELIKAYNAEMMGVFYERSSADRRKLWDMIHEEMVHTIDTGAVRNEKIREIITFAYETGYRMESQEPSAENTWGGGIYVPKEYRGEMDSLGGLRAVNRKMMSSGIYFTYKRKKKGTDIRFGSIDEAYNELLSINPMMGETTDPSEQVSNIIDFFGGGEGKQTLKDMDEEFFETDFVEPYKDDIEKTVEKAFDDISTLARYEMTQKARKEGEEAGEKKGIEKGKKEASKEYAAEQKKEKKQQAKEEKKRVDAQRKADESTMRMHDRLVKEIQDEADRKYAAEEKKKEKERQKMDEETLKEHDRLMKEEERKRKKEVKEELNKQAKEYKEAQKAERKSYEEIIKGQEKQKKKLEKEMDQQERQKKREEDSKRDKDRRGERIQLAQQEAKRRREKPQPGSTKSMYLNNKNVRKLCFEFRTDVISRLVEMGLFTDTNGEVVIDNNGMEVAWKTTYGKWEASNKKNEYTPYWGLTTLAEKEGIDADTFYTIYSKLVKMKKQGKTEGKNPKQRIVEYIESLDLTVKQKMFLYFDAAKYAYSNRPGTGNTKPFTDGGTVTEPKGNIRGIMIRLLDDITFDMYRNANMAPTLLQSEESRQIRQKDITDFLDAVFGEETSEQKDQFAAYFMGIIEDLSSQIESARMIAMSNLLIDKPQEKNSLRMNIVRSYRQTKRQFVAEGEAFERMSRKLKDPLYAAYYYGAKKYTAVANEMIYGKGQRGLDGKKQGKSLYQIFEPIFKADEKNKNNEKMKLLTLFVNCRHDQYRLMNGKGYTGYTVEECKDIVERISEKHPEIVKAGDEIADYGRNLLRMCVESGRLSEEDYQYYTIKYPYYVPAFRYVERTYYDREGKVVRRDKDVIRKAKGGTQPDVLPLFDQMVNKTNEIVKVCKKNQLAGRLANAYRLGATEYIADVRLTEAEERKKKKAEREQKKKEKQAKKNGGVVEKNLVSEEETPMEDMIDAIGEEEENLEDIIPWYSNGVKYEIEVADEGILIGWDKLSPIKNEKDWLKVLRKFNDFRRGVLTQYNPTFWFTNGIKDLQDLFLYYPHAQRIPKYYAIAVKTMFAGNVTGLKKGIDKRRGKQTDEERKNEAMLQEYLAYGMAESSIFQYDETEGGRRKKRTKVKGALRKPLDLFDGLNFSVEQLPRFAVYLETIDRLEKQRKKGGNEYTDEEIKTIAVYNASDATVNFGRSGTVVKNLNTYGCTFLNAGVQGTSKFVRMFTQVKDGNVKTIAFRALGIGVKLSIFGLSPRILNDIFYGDDDDDKGWMQDLRKLFFKDEVEKVQKEYAEMADYQKLNYYLIYFAGKWIRIDRGRVAAFVRSFEFNGTKVSEDEMDALDLVIAQMDMASDTILFGNPITNNILGPCIEVWNNKDNWGREIVSEYEDKGEGFHYLEYDEDTSDLAIKLAEFGHYLTGTRFGKENSRLLDFSPKKLDHLISQYLGSYSNLIVPFLSGDQTLSEKGMDAVMSLAKKFYVDPTLSNRLAGDYYDLKEEYTNIANAHDGDSPYAVVDYVFKDYNEQLKVKREMIQTITADPNMTRKQKLDRVSEIRAEMNELYRQGIADAKDLLGYADANYFGKEGNREVYEDWLDLTKDSDWKLSTMSDSAQAMYNEISSTGVTTDNFVKAYNFFGNLTGDKDENGKTIRNSKRDKFVTYLNSLPATAEQKKEMYYSIGGYSRNKEAPTFADGEYKQPVLTDMISPLASGGRISSGYGNRVCPFDGPEFHAGVDIAAPSGTAVGSALSGTVTMAAYSGSFGNTVEVTSVDANGNTIVTKYNHMSELGVEVGDVIGQGVQVGKVGSTGNSTGPHLDFRLKINGEWVDPEQYLDLESAGVVNSTGYSAKAASGGSASGGYASSGGGGSKSSGSKSGGGSSGGRRSSGTATASTGSRRSSTGIGSSGGSSGGVTLPTASQASAITGRSTKATTYSQGGITLPTAKDLARSRGTISSTASAKSTQRTGRSKGSFWNENILG